MWIGENMDIQTQLFVGQLIRLGPVDHEKDPEIESRWTHDLAYLRAIGISPARPISPAQVKKKYEAIEKEMDESKNLFYFAIRSRADAQLLGFTRIYWVEWTHGTGNLSLGIGDPVDRRKGYGSDALRLMLRFAFAELNLYRLTVALGEDNSGALQFFEKFGFQEEVRRRKALQHDGQTWDLLHLGLLAEEWREQVRQAGYGS
jgi:RimJ/RimL family protein N-acetyltransferase